MCVLLSAAAVAACGCGVDESSEAEPETITSELVTANIYIDSGSKVAVGSWLADQDFPTKTGSTTINHPNTIDVSGVTSPAPQAVYQTARTGAVTYTIPGFTAASTNRIRLHFAETYWTAAGKRVFNVSVNGKVVLPNFDIYKTAAGSAKGAKGNNKAVVQDLNLAASSTGTYVIAFSNVTDQPLISGIEIDLSCNAGTACTPSNVCAKGTISCSTGSPVCVAGGADTSKNGTSCGTNQFCNNGTCGACTAGATCTPTNLCHTGTISCSTGSPVCTDTGTNVADNTTCGGGNICVAGSCTCKATTANVPAPAAYYPYDTNALDVDHGFAGTDQNLVLTQGIIGNSYFFNGTLDGVNNSGVGNESFAYLGLGPSQVLSGARTICAWIGEYPPASGPGMAIFSDELNQSAFDHLAVQSSAPAAGSPCGGPNEVFMVDGTNGCQRSGLTVDPSLWNYVCYAYDGSSHATFFVNGQTSTLTIAPLTVPVWNGNAFMGNAQATDPYVLQGAFSGYIDEVTLWSSYVPASAMSFMYNGGNGCKAP
jgi:hypothetical protein